MDTNVVYEGMGKEILTIDTGQHGCVLRRFSKHFIPLDVYIKLNSLVIFIGLESKSIPDLRLLFTYAILTPSLFIAHSLRPLVHLFVGQGDFYFSK